MLSGITLGQLHFKTSIKSLMYYFPFLSPLLFFPLFFLDTIMQTAGEEGHWHKKDDGCAHYGCHHRYMEAKVFILGRGCNIEGRDREKQIKWKETRETSESQLSSCVNYNHYHTNLSGVMFSGCIDMHVVRINIWMWYCLRPLDTSIY